MRSIKLLCCFILMAVGQVNADTQFEKMTEIRKTVDNGKVTFSESGFTDKKAVKKAADPTPVVTPPKITAPKVDVYYASWDPYSDKAIVFFREKHIVVTAYDIDLDADAAARKKKIDPNFAGLPLVIINGIVIRGVDEAKYNDALATKPTQ